MTQETTSNGYEAKLSSSWWDTSGQIYDPNTGVTTTAGNIQIGTTGPIYTPPCPTGHVADPNYAEYLDGEIATSCMVCGQRIVLPTVPGGVPLLRLKSLLENIMGGDFDKSRALEDFAAITDALKTERTVLDSADALAALARTLLEQ